MRIQLTYELAIAAARDAANRRMRAGCRKQWDDDDYNAAVREFHRLIPYLPDQWRYQGMPGAEE